MDEFEDLSDPFINHRSDCPIQPSPQLTSVNIDMASPHRASFTSQRSSSFETLGCSPVDTSDKNILKTKLRDTMISSALSAEREECDLHNGSLVERNNVSATFQHWLNDEVTPPATLCPGHHSTPVKDKESLSTVSEEASSGSEREFVKETFMPGELRTPILGYETVEARSKFTIFKIHVQKTVSEVPPTNWFVFRRYSDFLYLNMKLKYKFPEFQFYLPPKRWFRDNFDKEFLDRRRLGLQLFLDNVTGHRNICNSEPVRDFFCTDDPPGPHDTLEESRALCDTLEESLYYLRQELFDKSSEIDLLKEELGLYKSQVDLLTKQLRVVNSSKRGGGEPSCVSCSVNDHDDDPRFSPTDPELMNNSKSGGGEPAVSPVL